MKTLTIFTPAYNRAHTIGRTYESLCKQTCKDFEWLIVDDGSDDDTQSLVNKWIEDNIIPIRYIYQANQGMHGAHNTAYENIDTELNVCIDSDDWMPVNAVQTIIDFWQKKRSDDVAGFVGLDITDNNVIIGDKFNTSKVTMWNFFISGGRGDKKIVYRTDVIKRYPPYPIFEGEKYVSLASKYFLIDQDFPLLTINKPLVVVEYQESGSSFNMYRNYVMNPHGFVYDRKLVLSYKQPLKIKIKYCIHYVADKFLANEWKSIISDSPCKLTTLLTIPMGYCWYRLILHRYKTNYKIRLQK